MVKCSFCGNPITNGTGTMFVQNDGKIWHFCSSKCKKNQLKLKRKAIHTKWTARYME